MFGFIEKMFIILLTSLVNASSHTKCVSLSNQKCQILNFHPNEYNQELHCCPIAVKLERCVGNCNTLNPNLGGLFRGLFWGGVAGKEVKLPLAPGLKLTRIMLENSN